MNARSLVVLSLVLFPCWLGLAKRAAAQVKYRTVALSGQAAPGTPAGVNYSFSDFSEAYVIIEAGRVSYRVYLTGSGVTGLNDIAIYAGPLAAPQFVARAGDAAPGTPAGVNYSSGIGYPVLNDAGQVAYSTTLTGSGVTGSNFGAIYAGPFTSPQLVARDGDAAPGTPAGVNYSNLGVSYPALNDAGQVAYRARLTGSGVTTANNEALYAGPIAAPQVLARSGEAAPGLPAGVNYAPFFALDTALTLNDAGQVAYRAGLTGSGVTDVNDRAIYAGPMDAPQLVAREGDAAPGTPTGVNYSFLSEPALNDAGQVAYRAVLTGSGVIDANARALYAGPLAAPQLVARSGDPAPGMPAGVNYSYFQSPPGLNDAGQAAYGVVLTGSGVTFENEQAIYAGSLASPQLLVRSGDAAPGTPAGVNYLSFSTSALNDAGQVAYVARLTGGGVTQADDFALFVSDPMLGVLLIAREGNLFDVGGGDMRTIADISFVPGSSDDVFTGLSNDSTLAFSIQFTDRTVGIFTARIVPEPGTVVLLAALGVTLVGHRSVLAGGSAVLNSSRGLIRRGGPGSIQAEREPEGHRSTRRQDFGRNIPAWRQSPASLGPELRPASS